MRFRHSCSALAGTLAITSLTLAGGAASAASPTTGAATVQRIGVPDHATLTIHGRGYGHGHGMSQWGAQGAALKGLSAKQIVKFYYPHTKAGHVGGKVRVLICADTDNNTTVVNRSGLRVLDLKSGRTSTLPATGKAGHATQWRMSAGSGSRTRVSFRNDGWHLWQKLRGDGEFTAPEPIKLVTGSGKVTYRGSLQSRTPSRAESRCPVGSRRVTVNKTSLEAYVQGVVPREAYTSWKQAALRAQAIAARSYAASEEADSTNPVYQLCDTTSCQVYGGKTAEVASTNEATVKTKGQVRTYHGKPAFTQFSASNGGWLAAGSKPYLVAKKDPYDGTKDNPNHTWTMHRTAGAIEKSFPALGNLQKITVLQRDGNGKWNGRVESMKLVGSKGSTTVSGDTFRSYLGLLSTWFDISVAG
jgi:stage II sporulation protein D